MGKQYDTAVIGGGPGGYIAAIRLAQLGKKTVLIEKDKIGGTCLNRGCIPTRALLQSAEVYRTVREAEKYGVFSKDTAFDFKKISERKESIVSKLRQGVAFLEKKAGVEVINGEASFRDAKTLIVGDEEIKAENIIIATGSAPARIPIPGIDSKGVIDSDGVLALTECPKSVAIIGGGVIGAEFATLFNALGAKVTVIEMLLEILPPIDGEIAAMMHKEFTKKGIDVFTGAKVTKIEPGVTVHFEQDGSRSVNAEACIVAIGRRPVADGLKAENIGLKMTRGFIDVDEYMKTNVSDVYAIGDVTGKIQLAHVASAQGLVAAHNITGENRKMDYDAVPSCVYTEPEIACVGLKEAEAIQKGLDIEIGRFPVSANGRSMIIGETVGEVKIISDKRTGEILGCHILAPRATDMIGELCVLMRTEGTIEELGDTIHAHPTVSEMIMEAVHDVQGKSMHKVRQ